MWRFLSGILIWMAAFNVYADCKILHIGNKGMICMRPDGPDVVRPALCAQVADAKYCASLVAGNSSKFHVVINDAMYSAIEFVESAESIRFDGKSYIDLGFVPTTDLNFEIRADLDESENNRDGALMGARLGNKEYQYVVWYNTVSGYPLVAPRFFENGFVVNELMAPDDIVTMRWENNVFTINGIVQDIAYFSSIGQIDVNLVLGGLKQGEVVNTRRFLGDIYYAKFWNDNGVIMDLIAATDANGTACMYDKVSGRILYPKH